MSGTGKKWLVGFGWLVLVLVGFGWLVLVLVGWSIRGSCVFLCV